MESPKNETTPKAEPLLDCIYILGLSPKTLRNMYLDSNYTSAPEIIIQLPSTQSLSNHILKAIFHPFHINLRSSPQYPSYYSTSSTDSQGKTEFFHCLRLWEKVSPTILEYTKERRNPPGFMSFIENSYNKPSEPEPEFYTEIVICLKTFTKHIDLYRKILRNLYSYLHSFEGEWSNSVVSVEFMKTVTFLLTDLEIPRSGLRVSFEIGRQKLEIPQETEENIGIYESCIGVLMDLVDIKNIIAVWECILLGQSVVLMSSNEYTIYLVLQAFIQLLFPFKATQYCIPIIDAEDLTQILPNKPLIVGMKSGELSVKDLQYIDQELNYLNIDSNSLTLHKNSALCDCLRTLLGQKLQYLKSFYYVDHERLNIYRMTSLEKAIKDTDFFKKVKILAEARSQKLKNRIFVELVRKLFFSIFYENFSDFPKYIIEQSFSGTEFQKDLFLQKINNCEKCSLEDFWTQFFTCGNFKEFLETYEKTDGYPVRFLKICENFKGPAVSRKREEINLLLSSQISTKTLFKSLILRFNTFATDSVSKRFTVDTALGLLKDFQSKIGEETEEPAVKKHKIFQNSLEQNYFDRKKFEVPNIFYGDFSILQFMKGLVQPISENFRVLCNEDEILKDSNHRMTKSLDCSHTDP